MALNHSKSVTAHENSINRTIKYVYKLTLNKGNVLNKGETKT